MNSERVKRNKRRYRQRHRLRLRDLATEYRRTHPDETRAAVDKYRAEHRDQLIERCRRFRVTHPSYHLDWRKVNRLKMNEWQRVYQTTVYAKQYHAGVVARTALRDGKLRRPNKCELCRRKCKPHMHHQDYDRPLQVDWLCRKCHTFIHNCVRELIRIAS